MKVHWRIIILLIGAGFFVGAFMTPYDQWLCMILRFIGGILFITWGLWDLDTSRNEQGQGLVEMALVTPVLIFMLIGVFEVGWALRGYLVLANANREAGRFAVRQNYLNMYAESYDKIGYQNVWTHTQTSLAGQLWHFDPDHATMIISYLKVEAMCTSTYTVTTPAHVSTYTWKFPITSTEQTWLNYQSMAVELGTYQKKHACDVVNWSGVNPLPNEVIVVEMWYKQPQIFGFPLISNPYTDPVPMYTHSTFRKIPESRPDGFVTPTIEP